MFPSLFLALLACLWHSILWPPSGVHPLCSLAFGVLCEEPPFQFFPFSPLASVLFKTSEMLLQPEVLSLNNSFLFLLRLSTFFASPGEEVLFLPQPSRSSSFLSPSWPLNYLFPKLDGSNFLHLSSSSDWCMAGFWNNCVLQPLCFYEGISIPTRSQPWSNISALHSITLYPSMRKVINQMWRIYHPWVHFSLLSETKVLHVAIIISVFLFSALLLAYSNLVSLSWV